jgi:hypothetical protein
MHHAMARHARVIALQHHIADGARRAGATGEHRDESIARDTAARDLTYDGVDTRVPVR